MDFEKAEERRSVREGYVVLLRAKAELLLPTEDHPVMRSFYQRIVDACMSWTTEIYGERLRAQLLSLQDIRDKSRFRAAQYRFWMRIPWQEPPHITVLCETEQTDPNGKASFYRICHTWNTEEQTILPYRQTVSLFRPKISKREMPFEPHCLYREGDKIVVFQNETTDHPFMEVRLPMRSD